MPITSARFTGNFPVTLQKYYKEAPRVSVISKADFTLNQPNIV